MTHLKAQLSNTKNLLCDTNLSNQPITSKYSQSLKNPHRPLEKNMKPFKWVVISSFVALATSCGGGTPPPVADTTPPTIVTTLPANNATGVVAATTIVITFSEPMNKLVTQSAYQSASPRLTPPVVQFTWDATGTVMTVTPNVALAVASGANPDPAVTVANTFSYQITNVATDLAGNALATASSTFKTQRRITQDLPLIALLGDSVRADGAVGDCLGSAPCAGDSGSAANAQWKGFIGFDMTGVPAGIQSWEFANINMNQTSVRGAPYATLGGTLLLDHVNFPTLNAASFNAVSLRPIGTLSTTATVENKTLPVLVAVQDDYANRVARGNRTQYRLAFPTVSDFDGVFDVAVFAGPNTLNVRYFLP